MLSPILGIMSSTCAMRKMIYGAKVIFLADSWRTGFHRQFCYDLFLAMEPGPMITGANSMQRARQFEYLPFGLSRVEVF